MRSLRHRWFAAACALLLLTQAVLPRELVCCIQDGAASLELSNHGRCIGQLNAPHACSGSHTAAADQPAASSFAADTSCIDQQILTPEVRAGRSLELSAPPCVSVTVMPHLALAAAGCDDCAACLMLPPERTVWKPPTTTILRI